MENSLRRQEGLVLEENAKNVSTTRGRVIEDEGGALRLMYVNIFRSPVFQKQAIAHLGIY